jgi:hypothetical protein
MFKKFLSYFFVFLLVLAVLSFFQIAQAQDGILYFSPSKGTFEEGESFWLTIMVDTKGEAVNAVAAYLSYPEDRLEPIGVNTAGSAMTIWAEKGAEGGKVEIAGGKPTPGFSGIKKIASVGFKAKAASGSVNLKFSEDSAVLTDAENKNILNLTSSGQGNYSFKPKSAKALLPSRLVISEIETKEINQTSAVISWQTDEAADSVVEYGLTSDYGLVISDDKLTEEHSLILFGLNPGTPYHFKIKSQAGSGKVSESEDLTFSTLGYQLEIKILSARDSQPFVGAEVIFPIPEGEISKITDREGRVVFDNLPSGKTWLSIKYKNTSFSYPLEVLSQEETQKAEIKLKVPEFRETLFTVITLAFIMIIIGALGIVIFKLLKRRSKKINPPVRLPESSQLPAISKQEFPGGLGEDSDERSRNST